MALSEMLRKYNSEPTHDFVAVHLRALNADC